MKTLLAQQIENPALEKFGKGEGAVIIAELIANFFKITFSLALLILMGMLIWGAIEWMTSGKDDKVVLVNAKRKISLALTGFLIFFSIFAFINWVAPLLGLEFLNILEISWPTPQ